MEVDVPGFPLCNNPYGLCGRKATLNDRTNVWVSKLRNCVKVEVDVPGFPLCNSPYGLCGRKATLNDRTNVWVSELMCCVKVEVAVLSSPDLMVSTVSVDVQQH